MSDPTAVPQPDPTAAPAGSTGETSARAATEGLITEAATTASPAAAARQEWVFAYVSRYGGYQLPSTWAADALLVLADAIERAGRADRVEVRDHLESTRIDGITGPVRFTAEQHSGLAGGLVILTATGDRWQ